MIESIAKIRRLLQVAGLTGALLGAGVTTLQAQSDDFVADTLTHIIHHEMAHALIDAFELPLLGPEEDAADAFSTLHMISTLHGRAVPALRNVSEAWLVMHAQDGTKEMMEYYGEHDLSDRRALWIVCLLYGSDPSRFDRVATWADLPPWRKSSCRDEARTTRRSWSSVLRPHLSAPGSIPEAPIRLNYEDPGALTSEATFLRELGLLEAVAEDYSSRYQWVEPVGITAKNCGEANAFWNAEDNRIEICYELVSELRRLDQGRRLYGWKSLKKRKQ